MELIGRIEKLQVQRAGLKKGQEPLRIYDPAPLQEVPALRVGADGVVGLLDGREILDVHHHAHAHSKNRQSNAVSFNFTAHYRGMQARFGPAFAVGSGGENILIGADRILTVDELGEGLLIEAAVGRGRLIAVQVASPCVPFSTFTLNLESRPPAEVTRENLQFLGGGMRGFYCDWEGGPLIVRLGDRVYRIG